MSVKKGQRHFVRARWWEEQLIEQNGKRSIPGYNDMSGENNILEKAIIETKTKLLATKMEENKCEQKWTEAKRKK